MPIGIYPHKRGWKQKEDTKRKISISNRIALKRFYQKGGIPWNKGKRGAQVAWNKGIPSSNKTKILLSRATKNDGRWKGANVGYRGLHSWVKRWKGEPKKCENCKKIKTTSHSIHWANKSHKYQRNLRDWIALCVSCHSKYDDTLKKAWQTRKAKI